MESIPEELKFISPYYQRAKELKVHEPIIAYYCNYYAAKLAIAKGAKDKECQLFLVTLLDNLEQEKRALANNEVVNDDEIGKAYIENFAAKVFLNADNEDRAGKATKKTVKTFLAASIFLELLKIFGQVEPEVEEKIKYAKWKATDIMKALKEGRTPHPGPPGWEPSEATSGENLGLDEFEATDNVPKLQDFPPPPSFSPQFDSNEINQPNFNTSVTPQNDFHPNGTHMGQDYGSGNPNSSANRYQSSPHDLPSFPEFPSTLPSNSGSGGYSSQSSFDQGQGNHGRNEYRDPSSFYATSDINNSSQNSNPGANQNFTSGISQQPSNGYNSRQNQMPPSQPDYQAQPSYQQQHYRPEPHQDEYAKFDMDPKAISMAQKHSRFAISALEYDDVKTAIENLRKALALLEPYKN